MQPAKNDGRRKIDLETWERRAAFHFFKDFTEPFHGVCVRVDCTETFQYAKEHSLSVTFALFHRCLVAAQLVENFRTRIVDGTAWLYERIHGGSAVGRPNGTIGFAYYPFHENIEKFAGDASVEAERVRNREDIEQFSDVNYIRFSTLPWLDFTSLSHARNLSVEDSLPRITLGKITEANGRRTMPVSIHVHHALADGLHVAQFVDQLQRYLADPCILPANENYR
jgi:chloramphenicol O-acetyltransferase type A